MGQSRFTQYGGAAGADAALQEMVAQRILQQQAMQKQAIEAYKLQQADRGLDQGDARIGQGARGLDLEERRLNAPPAPKGPITVSPGASVFDPESGRIVTTAPAAPEKPAGPMNLGPGSVIADPATGRIIVRNPQQAAGKDPQADLALYEQKKQIDAKYGGTRPSIGAEKTALAYYNRAKSASEDIAPMEDSIAKAGTLREMQLQYAPNIAQTGEQQRYRQAQRAFTEARLRKESGAAIPTAEYENDAKTYFAQPGDDPPTMLQKRQARQAVLDGLKFSAGKAYEEFYGEPNQSPAQQQQQRGTAPVKWGRDANGRPVRLQ